ncbi:hypothetical protein B0H16DRAFT_1745469 [Mycena metata]|uniref:Uncharacterized protein n=1 Tax=Mycena metata TaxID=1033252 RepID=A0AAD7H3P3_9AGAR|nr:hypothetical protein B0H16DRAFT_1745469 [Mycena metata]
MTLTHWTGPPSASFDHDVVCKRLAECGVSVALVDDAYAYTHAYLIDHKRGRIPSHWLRDEYEQAVAIQEKFTALPSLNKEEVEVFARSPVLPWRDEAWNLLQYRLWNWLQEDLMVDYCQPIRRPPHSKIALAIGSNHARPSRFTGLLWKHHPWRKDLHALGVKVGQDPNFNLVEFLKHYTPGASSTSDRVIEEDADMPLVADHTTTTTVDSASFETTPSMTTPDISETTPITASPPADFATTQTAPEENTTSTSQASLMDVAMAVGFSFTDNPLAASAYAPTTDDLLTAPPDPFDWSDYEGILHPEDVPSGDVYDEFLNTVSATESVDDDADLGA